MNKRRWRKSIRYLRWISKAAFLVLFTIPIAYVPASRDWQTPWAPVTSLLLTPAQPFLYLPLVQSPCSIWLSGWSNPVAGSWIVEPLGAIQALLTGKVEALLLAPTLIALSIAIALVVLLGTAFCSWVCPIGTIVDSFDKGVEKFLPKIEAKRAKIFLQNMQSRNNTKGTLCKWCPISKAINNRAVANGILVTSFAAAPVLGFNVFCTICPIGISTRGLFHLKATSYLTKIINPIFLELLMFPVIAVALSLRERRFFCNKFCPVGALFGGIASLNPFIKPKVKPEKCIMKGCPSDCEDYHLDYCGFCRLEDDRKCEKVCPAGIHLVDNGSLHRCTKCLECYIACDYDAIKVDLMGKPDVFRIGGFFRRLRTRWRKGKVTPIENRCNATG